MDEPRIEDDHDEGVKTKKRSPVVDSDDEVESATKPDQGSLGDDDSDDEPVVRSVRRKKRVNRSFLDDSDSEDETPNSPNDEARSSSRSRSNSPVGDAPSPKKSDAPSPKKSDVRSTSDNLNDADTKSQENNEKVPENTENENKTAENVPEKKKFFKLSEIHADLFDSDSGSDENKENKSDSSSSDNEDKVETEDRKSEGDAQDESDDESLEMSATLKKRLKMGAAKKEKSRPDRAAKPKKTDLTEIYGESQRLVRESELRLPYHKPQPPALSGFLAKMQQKQSQLGYLKKTPGKSWKNMHVMHSQVTPPKIDLTKSSPLKENSRNLMKEIKDKCSKENIVDDLELEDDELPDLVTRVASAMKEKTKKDRKETNCTVEITESAETASTKDPSDNAKIPEQDSGYLTTPGVSSEEENSSEPANNDVVDDKQKLVSEDSIEREEAPVSESTNDESKSVDTQTDNNKTENTKESSPKGITTSKSSGLSQGLSSLGVTGVTPSLSGGPDWMIDLDEDESPKKKPTGVTKLMERLMKHSTKRQSKKGHDVELSTVEVDKDEVTGKEELKMKKVTIHIDDEEEEDPKLNQPGAKLIRLKETLAAEMARKRAELRKEKMHMHELENEEGFDMDDEAELTDQTDTDNEADEEEVDEEEEGYGEEEEVEDMDELENPDEEEKEDNPFVDDEAEDDQDEEHMHLELDADDDDSNAEKEEKEEKSKTSKNFLKTALQKTKTVDLFDDDAFNDSDTIKSGCQFLTSGDMSVDDSITLSQNNRREKIQLSDRPFKSLSQERRPNSVEEYLKEIENENDSLEEDSTLEKDSSLDETSMPTVSTDDLSHSKLSLFEKDGSSMASNDASFDSVASSLIQPGQRMTRRETPDLFTPSSRGSIAACSTANKSSRRLSELAMPIEDTQDLLKCSPASESTPRIGNLSFNLDDSSTYSQMLDSDGLLKLNSSGKKAARRQLELGSLLRATQDNEDELLELCSGKFTGGTDQGAKSKGAFSGLSQMVKNNEHQNDEDELLALCSGQFTGAEKPKSEKSKRLLQTQTSHDGNVDELLDLCSGQFTDSKSPEKKKKKGKKRRIMDDSDNEDNGEEDFEIASNHGAQSDRDVDELASDTEKQESDDEEENQRRAFKDAFKGFRSKKGKLRMDFVDAEAELSGSECESDEDLDLDERDDVMEEELGDLEDLPSDDELRNQVGRVHLKNMIDQDKRELKLYQEMYLADGDLHSEGSGRQRRFRWKNVDDDDTQQDMFNSDDEKEDVEEEADIKWRMERFEREKFLNEQEAEAEDESGSQVLKLGKAIFKPKKAKETPVVEETPSASTSVPQNPVVTAKKSVPKSPKNLFKVPSLKRSTHGSFLSRSKDTLAKIAEMTKPVSNPTGPRNSRNFVFSTVEKEEVEGAEESQKPQPVKRSNSVPASASKPAKRQKLERSASVLPQNSVFHLFD